MNTTTESGIRRGGIAAGFVAVALVVSTLGIDRLTAQQAPQFESPQSVSFADIVEQVNPAVVNIAVTKTARSRPTAGRQSPQFDDFFERFFGIPAPDQMPRERRQRGVGSGFVIDRDGYIVTNNHVIDNAEEVVVTFVDGSRLDAEVVGFDPQTDLALLKVDSDEPLPFVQFGDSDGVRVGDWVLAIGNPFGLGGTATAGILSARGRDIQSGPYDDYMQIDAPINQGNSGGPVFNASGEVVGINTAIFSPSGGNVGIGFAIPANQAASIVAQLQESGSVTRGWLGVSIQDIDDDLATTLGLDEAGGALVAEVIGDSPADAAGLVRGDVIRSFDGEPIDGARTLSRVVAGVEPGSRVEVGIVRGGEAREIRVRLGDQQQARPVAAQRGPAGGADTNLAALGVELAPLTDRVRADLGLDAGVEGVVIMRVAPGSPAAEKGLRRGDVITEINRSNVGSIDDAAAALQRAGGEDGRALLLVRRGEGQRFVAVNVG